MKKLTLQWRITLLTAAILAICSAGLTIFSIFNAQQVFFPLLTDQYVIAGTTEDSFDVPANNTEGVETGPAVQAKRQFDTKSILFCLLATTVGSCAVYFTAGQALRPLRILSDEIETVDEENLSAQLPQAATQDEVGRLTNIFQ